MSGVLVVLATALLWTGWSVVTLFRNYQRARCLKSPILISPVGIWSLFWLILHRQLSPVFQKLPFGIGGWTRYNHMSWTFLDRGQLHEQYGKVIVHVTPREVEVWISDRDLLKEILKGKNRSLFEKPGQYTQAIDLYGPQLLTAEGMDWQRHRRAVAPLFNQFNTRLVWKEALKQGQQLCHAWMAQDGDGINSVWHDTETVTLNVVMAACFGIFKKFRRSSSTAETDVFDFQAALRHVLINPFLIGATPKWLFDSNYQPPFRPLRQFLLAVRYIKNDMAKSIKCDRVDSGIPPTGNVLAALAMQSRGLEDEKFDRLSEDDIYGNMFGITWAGHETTAHTLSYALFQLAIHPDIQNWLSEEINNAQANDQELQDYDIVYPQLPRCRALMYETLRLYPAVLTILKYTNQGPVRIVADQKVLDIPRGTMVYPDIYALHVDEESWGKDRFEWRPSRWIQASEDGSEEFLNPAPPGAYIPWSDGPRNCPGQKFAVAEFIAIVMVMLRKHKLEAVPRNGETDAEVKNRVMDEVQNSHVVLTLGMARPEKVFVRLSSRS